MTGDEYQIRQRHAGGSWVVTGELRDARFEVPDDNPDVIFSGARLINVDFSGLAFALRQRSL